MTAHNPETCTVCGPYVNAPAYHRGLAKAAAEALKAEQG